MTGSTSPPAAHAATQERSRLTLERILESAERLLADRDFRELTMSDLAAEAGCAVGTVYGRIPDKESLLACLHERHVRIGQKLSEQVMHAAANAGLAGRCAAMCRLVVEYLSAQPGVCRAITTYLFQQREDVRGFRKTSTAAFRQAAGFLAEAVDPKRGRRALRDAEFGLLAVLDVAESRIAFGEHSRVQLRYPKRELERRLTHLLLSYLEHPQP